MKTTLLSYTTLLFTFILLSACDQLPVSETNGESFTTELQENWRLFSSDELNNETGDLISTTEFDTDFGYPVTLPATVMHGLMQNGYYPDIFEAFVLEAVDTTQFKVPWWYRTEFEADNLTDDDYFQLTFDGINFKANIWLNGEQIAREDSVQGSFGVWNFDVTDHITEGRNILAVEIIPPVYGQDISLGFVDWNPTPPDRSMGIWRDVWVSRTGPVSMRHHNVVSKVNKETLDEAELTISTQLTNHSNEPQQATVSASFDGLTLTQNVELAPREVREIFFRPDHFEELNISNPRLWWPNKLGEPHLYDLDLEVTTGRPLSDAASIRFGIREIEEFWTEDMFRGFKVNGQKIMIRSAGWVDDMFLADPDQKVIYQMNYAKHLNLNSIRLESFWGRNRTLMDMADENGLLLMIGWTAHWEWESYTGIPHDEYVTIRGEEEKTLHANNYRDQVMWHRHHPSVAIWTYGSDKLPRPSLEIMLNERMAHADTTRPILNYCGGGILMEDVEAVVSEISGPSGMKMEGPYDWVPPVYWYIDDQYGGAFGFNTETGPGPQIPPISSIKRMIPEDHLWPIDDVWLYHSGRNQFENLDRFLDAFYARYGESDNLEDFLFKNQMANYEALRPMFEAFSVNKYESTGLVQWMYNTAWPAFYWQLFDYYLMPTGAFYATQKAAAPLSAIYNYGDNHIYVNNDFFDPQEGLTLQTTVLDLNSNILFEDELVFDIDANSAELVLELPENLNLTDTWFLDLYLADASGNEIHNNFYWLSVKEDVPDFENTTWYYTPNKEHADFTAIYDMPKAGIHFSYDVERDGDDFVITTTLDNPSDLLAFFIELHVMNSTTGEPVLPVFWDDNYISLLPGEERVLKATVPVRDVQESQITVEMQGWNLN